MNGKNKDMSQELVMVQQINKNSQLHVQGNSSFQTVSSTSFDNYETFSKHKTDKTSFEHGPEDTTNTDEQIETGESRFKVSNLSRRNKLILASSLFAFFVGGCGYSVMAPIFPQEAEKKGMSLTIASFIFSEYELVILITSPFFGSYLTTIGCKFVVVSGTFVAGVCIALFGLLDRCPSGTTFLVLSILCRGIGAIGLSAIFISVMAIVANEFPKYITTFFAFLISALGTGFMVGPAMGGVLYDVGGFGLPFYVIGGLMVVSGALVYVYMPGTDSAPKNNSVSMLTLLRSPMILIAIWSVVIAVIGLTFLDPTLALHLEPFGFSATVVGLFFMIIPVLLVITAPLYGYLTDVKGIFTYSVVIGLLVLGLGFLFIGPSDVLPFVPFKVWSVIVGLILVGIAFEAITVGAMKCMVVGANELGFEEDLDTCACLAGVFNATYSLGGFLGPMAGGVLVELLGFSLAYTVVGLLSIVIGIVSFIFFINRDVSKRKSLNIDRVE